MDDTQICSFCLKCINGQYVSIDSLLIEKLQALCPDVKTTLLSLICPSCIDILQKFEYLKNSYKRTKETCKVCGVNVVDQYHVTSSDTLQMCDDLGFPIPLDSKVCDECLNTMYEMDSLKMTINNAQISSIVHCDELMIKDEVKLGPDELLQSHSNLLHKLNECSGINTTSNTTRTGTSGNSCEENSYCNKNDELFYVPLEHQVLGSPSNNSIKDEVKGQSSSSNSSVEGNIDEQTGPSNSSFEDDIKYHDEWQRKMKIPENFENFNELKKLGTQESVSHIQCNNEGAEDVQMFCRCLICTYKAKLKARLKVHLLIHKKPEDVEMFECSICGNKFTLKGSLKKHRLIHKKPEDIEMFECFICGNKYKLKDSLRKHLLIHKKPEDIEMFECHICKYKSNYKSNLRTHLLIHKKPEDIDMFECHICTYKSKQKSVLKKHLLIHI